MVYRVERKKAGKTPVSLTRLARHILQTPHKERANSSLNHGATFAILKTGTRKIPRASNGPTRGNMKGDHHDRVIFSDVENLEGFGTTSSESDFSMKQEWRRYGAARRKELIERDGEEGGTRFELHKKCRIEQYFSIADRVSRANRRPRFLGERHVN